MIQIPPNPGQMILDDVAMRLSPLLTRDGFVKFCGQRNLTVSRDQLLRFEELRVFTPVIRIANRVGDGHGLHIDGSPTAADFEAGRVLDTSAPGAACVLSDSDDSGSMPLYSAFQVWALERVLQGTTSSLGLEQYVEVGTEAVDWGAKMSWLIDRASEHVARLRSDPRSTAIPLLCQVISNRYLPFARGNRRSIQGGGSSHFGQGLTFSSFSWDWDSYCEDWDPASLVRAFALDEDSLERVYVLLVNAMRRCDPLWSWAELVRFVNQGKRDQLKGDALRAESYRQSAEMVRRLHLDLYGADLGPPEEMFGYVINHIPELEVRDDPREFLRYVVNQYDLNPQPKAVLFVEGETEVIFVKAIFERLFRMHHGVSGIEIVNLHGVDNATGNKKSDQFTAIFRLADYLHDQQTFAFIMLDNEGQAKNLRAAASGKASLFGVRSRAMPRSRIRIWRRDFELDNFSDTEIARALSEMPGHSEVFRSTDIKEVRSQWPARRIAQLFRERTGRDLAKPLLAKRLAEIVIDPETRRRPASRPVIKFLQRVSKEGWMNPLPVTQDVWRQNQKYLN